MIKKNTYFAGTDNEIKWYIIDANGKTLGRLATQVAMVLRGKNQPTYTPHVDMGNRVVVINAEKVVVTGKKPDQKKYYHYSGYPGGLKARTFKEMIQHKPEQVVQHAVCGMLPHNRLGRKLGKKLKVYRGPEHPHQAQEPQPLN
ncbi:50S ribosomal protein L13 [bacterium]|nr:50S ribosomal protein L13 [bacterium]